MKDDRSITYKMERTDALYLPYTDKKTKSTSTLVFDRESDE